MSRNANLAQKDARQEKMCVWGYIIIAHKDAHLSMQYRRKTGRFLGIPNWYTLVQGSRKGCMNPEMPHLYKKIQGRFFSGYGILAYKMHRHMAAREGGLKRC